MKPMMRVEFTSMLSSTLAFSTDLARIQTSQCAHSLFWDLGAEKTFTTHWSGGRVQVWVQVWAPALPASHLAIHPEGYSRRQSKVLSAKSMAELLEQHSGTACASRTGKHNFKLHKHKAYPNLLHSLLAVTGFVNLGQWWAVFFVRWNEISMDFSRTCYLPKQCSSLCSIFQSFVGLWSKNRAQE